MRQILMEEVRKQGFSLMLLFLAVYYFYQENAKIQAKVDKCTEDQLTMLKDVVQNNTLILADLKNIIQRLEMSEQREYKRDGRK
jgi:hypothetical protein